MVKYQPQRKLQKMAECLLLMAETEAIMFGSVSESPLYLHTLILWRVELNEPVC